MTRIGVVAGFTGGLVALIAFGLFVAFHTAPAPPASAVSAACPVDAKPVDLNFRVKDLSGVEHNLRQYAGKVLLIDFWATWCDPCKAEIPSFVTLYDKYRDMGFEIVGLLSMDEASHVPPFAEQYKMNYPILDANDRTDLEQAYGPIEGLPTSVLVSRDGHLCAQHLGFTPANIFEREIATLLAQ
ncbi:MAG: TlpA family protein disulfide reductase [Acidobacteriaceae bacterium]|jgi:cytochrome c biogenesis protein CcmG/thiol:disulfide interchange protein DsbE|nr:TlpA family protein disulfide reductase [Acidobacteriaceae bacterium]